MQARLAPVLFTDDDKPATSAARTSPVTPATPLPTALAKTPPQQTPGDQPCTTLHHPSPTSARSASTPSPDLPCAAWFPLVTTPTFIHRKHSSCSASATTSGSRNQHPPAQPKAQVNEPMQYHWQERPSLTERPEPVELQTTRVSPGAPGSPARRAGLGQSAVALPGAGLLLPSIRPHPAAEVVALQLGVLAIRRDTRQADEVPVAARDVLNLVSWSGLGGLAGASSAVSQNSLITSSVPGKLLDEF